MNCADKYGVDLSSDASKKYTCTGLCALDQDNVSSISICIFVKNKTNCNLIPLDTRRRSEMLSHGKLKQITDRCARSSCANSTFLFARKLKARQIYMKLNKIEIERNYQKTHAFELFSAMTFITITLSNAEKKSTKR